MSKVVGGFKLLFFIITLNVISYSQGNAQRNNNEFEIIGIYESVYLEQGSLVLDSFWNIAPVNKVLVPKELKSDTYQVQVSRITDNVYEVNLGQYYIRTRNCKLNLDAQKATITIGNNLEMVKGVLRLVGEISVRRN